MKLAHMADGRSAPTASAWVHVRTYENQMENKKEDRVAEGVSIQAAIDRWHTEGMERGKGNEEFMRLGRDLAIAGLPLDEVEWVLTHEASYANSPKQRQRDIPWIVETLRKYESQGRPLKGLCPKCWQKRNPSKKEKK